MRPLPVRRNRAHSSPERSGRLGGRILRRALIVIALSLAAASCGGAQNEPNLAEAAERTEAQGTGRFEASGEQRSEGRSTPVSCKGEADYGAKSVRVACEYGLEELDAIAIGDEFYVRGMLLVGTSDKWVRMEGEVDDDTSLATLSPQKLLRLLRNASSETERVGEEDVRGEPTVRYRLVVDCDGAKLDCSTEAPVDVWLADDGVVRRITFEDDDGTSTFEFFDFGADVQIEAPPAADVIEEDLVASGSSGGGASGGIEVTCADGEAVPIGQPQALAALRRNGFRMRDNEFCIVDNGASTADLPAEGLVTCGIDAVPRPGAPERVTFGIETGEGVDATLELRNVKCTIETGPDGRQRKIDALAQAFTELQQAIRP
jgi:hypothetical protein